MKLTQVHKMVFAALLLVLTIIFTRITPLQNIPIIPWIRISLGPALIIFTSIYLGPLYGAIVGAGSDILGILIVPNALGYGINPLFTVVYGLLGVVPYLIYLLVKRIKNPHIPFICLIAISSLLFIIAIYFLFFSPTVLENYDFQGIYNWLILAIAFVLLLGNVVAIYFINRFYKKRYGEIYSPYKIAFVSLISELLVLTLLNSFAKTFTFNVNFWVIFFAQVVVFFIDVPLNTFVVEGLIILINRIQGNRSTD